MPVLSSSSFSALVAEEKIGKDELFLSTGGEHYPAGVFGSRRGRRAAWNNGPGESV
jgi:hypothetical protein